MFATENKDYDFDNPSGEDQLDFILKRHNPLISFSDLYHYSLPLLYHVYAAGLFSSFIPPVQDTTNLPHNSDSNPNSNYSDDKSCSTVSVTAHRGSVSGNNFIIGKSVSTYPGHVGSIPTMLFGLQSPNSFFVRLIREEVVTHATTTRMQRLTNPHFNPSAPIASASNHMFSSLSSPAIHCRFAGGGGFSAFSTFPKRIRRRQEPPLTFYRLSAHTGFLQNVSRHSIIYPSSWVYLYGMVGPEAGFSFDISVSYSPASASYDELSPGFALLSGFAAGSSTKPATSYSYSCSEVN